jgi:hypothetical protein
MKRLTGTRRAALAVGALPFAVTLTELNQEAVA